MVNPIVIGDLTEEKLDGTGSFDVLMRSVKAHITEEYSEGRITGNDYTTVYLSVLQSTMAQAQQFTLAQNKVNLEDQALTLNVEILEINKEKAIAEVALVNAQVAKTTEEKALVIAEVARADSSKLLIDEQITKTISETAVVNAEVDRSALEKSLLEAQVNKTTKETALVQAQADESAQRLALVTAQTDKTIIEQNLVTAQVDTAEATVLKIGADTLLVQQNAANAIIEGTVLTAQECKLRVEFEVLTQTKLKIAEETALLTQKKVTEQAQVTGSIADATSIIGRQAALYAEQTKGFKKDGIQKAAKILIDTWSVRRTTDEGTKADNTNGLSDPNIKQAVDELLASMTS